MTDLSNVDRTRTLEDVTQAPVPEKTNTISDIVEDAGVLRSQSRMLNEGVNDLHHSAFSAQFAQKSHQLAQVGARTLLDRLSSAGFSWRDIARMNGVSVPAVRRWRRGESPTPDHLFGIARIVALKEIVEQNNPVADVASWLELPLCPPFPITGIDLAASGHFQELFDLAGYHDTPDTVLDRIHPEWRDFQNSDFEVFEADDGEMGIRLSGSDGD